MSSNSKENTRANLYVTLLVILMMVAVVVAVAGAVVRNVSKPAEDETKRPAVTTEADSTAPSGLVVSEDERPDTPHDQGEKDDPTTDDAAAAQDAETTDSVDAIAEDVLPKFSSPTGGMILQGYSMDVPVFSATMNDYRTHNGVDVSVDPGERVFAAADGVIRRIWTDPMMGQCISITHSGGAVSTYANLGEVLPDGIAEGAAVKAGDVIAAAGESALAEISEESHIHYELRIDGVCVNPAEYLTFEEPYEE